MEMGSSRGVVDDRDVVVVFELRQTWSGVRESGAVFDGSLRIRANGFDVILNAKGGCPKKKSKRGLEISTN